MLSTIGVTASIMLLAALRPLQAQRAPGARSISAESSFVHRLQTTLRSPPAYAIGELDGDPLKVFGDITRVAVDHAGNVFVLDQQNLNVRWFDPSGNYRGTAGRGGNGPGELRVPVGLAVEGGRVSVLDLRNSRISMFDTTSSGLKHVTDIRTTRPGYDMCESRSGYLVSTPQVDPVIESIGRDGRPGRSFAAALPREEASRVPYDEAERILRNRGRLLCLKAGAVVILAQSQTPDIRAFTQDGAQLWHTRLSDYHAVRRVPVPGRPTARTIAPDAATGTIHSLAAITQLPDDVLAITLFESAGRRDSKVSTEIRLIRLTDGKEIGGFQTERASVLVAATQSYLYSVELEPFPRITVVQPKPQTLTR